MKCTFYSVRGRVTSRNNEALVPIAATFATAIHHCVGVQNVITTNRLFIQVTFQNQNYPTSLNAFSWRSEKHFKFSTYLRLFSSWSDSQRFSPKNVKKFSIKKRVTRWEENYRLGNMVWFENNLLELKFVCLFVCLLGFFLRTLFAIQLNPLVPKILIVIPLTVCHIFLVILVWRFGTGSANYFSLKLFLFPSLVCLILYWYCKEKFCLGHPWELKGFLKYSSFLAIL